MARAKQAQKQKKPRREQAATMSSGSPPDGGGASITITGSGLASPLPPGVSFGAVAAGFSHAKATKARRQTVTKGKGRKQAGRKKRSV